MVHGVERPHPLREHLAGALPLVRDASFELTLQQLERVDVLVRGREVEIGELQSRLEILRARVALHTVGVGRDVRRRLGQLPRQQLAAIGRRQAAEPAQADERRGIGRVPVVLLTDDRRAATRERGEGNLVVAEVRRLQPDARRRSTASAPSRRSPESRGGRYACRPRALREQFTAGHAVRPRRDRAVAPARSDSRNAASVTCVRPAFCGAVAMTTRLVSGRSSRAMAPTSATRY